MLTFFSWALEDLGEQSIIRTLSNQSFKPFQSITHPNTRGPTRTINHSNLFNQSLIRTLEDLRQQSIIQTFSNQLFNLLQLGTRGPTTAINHSNPFQSIIQPSSAWHSRTYESNQSFKPFPINYSPFFS